MPSPRLRRGVDSGAEQWVRDWLAGRTGTDAADWHLVSKARHGLLVVLAEVAAARGPGEVVTQSLTCLTAVSPVIAAGHCPRYADISRDTLALDPATLPALVSEGTRAVLAQHTFGPAAPVAAVRERLPDPTLLVEDAAHCLGTLARGQDGAPAADVSLHSFGVEKMLPTRAGGAVWVNPAAWDRGLAGRLARALAALPAPGARAGLAHRLSIPARRITGRLGGPGTALLNRAARAGVVDLAVLPQERRGEVGGMPSRLAGRPLAAVAAALPDEPTDAAHRREVAARYLAALADLPRLDVPDGLARLTAPLVRLPVLAEDAALAEQLFARLQARGLVPGRWYRPTLFPGPTDPTPYRYQPATCPVAEAVSAQILNLPTAAFVTPTMVKEILSVLADPAA